MNLIKLKKNAKINKKINKNNDDDLIKSYVKYIYIFQRIIIYIINGLLTDLMELRIMQVLIVWIKNVLEEVV